ncbi:MAG TPA: hypothetical protein VI455_18605 [Terriglobia bacterium]
MPDNETHLSDKDLLLLTDGQLAPWRAARARGHLSACWECRTRMGDLERTIAAFVHAHRASLDPHLPPAIGPRALLKARLAESGLTAPLKPWYRVFEFVLSGRQWIYVCAALLLGAFGLWIGRYHARRESQPTLRSEVFPNRTLTPGVVRLVSRADVCGVEGEDEDNDPTWLIPAPVQQETLEEYGVAGAQAKEYELDYLIPPALGGTEDIRNLWPEPSETLWNARAKDALERRLRALVCGGQVDLQAAQHDIATDWISAYKRYFHTDKPISDPSKVHGV